MQPDIMQAAFIFALMEKDKRKKRIREFLFIVGLLSIFAVLAFTGIYQCPLKHFFGIPCPMCGLTRAFTAVLRGSFADAFYYHPLWLPAIIAGILYILCFFEIIRPPKKLFDLCCIILAASVLICFILRHVYGSPVVQTHFRSSPVSQLLGFPG